MESSRRLRPRLVALNKLQYVYAMFSLARDVRPTDVSNVEVLKRGSEETRRGPSRHRRESYVDA